jgi:hypothetical protein
MSTVKTATRRTRKTVDESVNDPQNTQGWTPKRVVRPKGWESTGAVSLARGEAYEPTGGWHRVIRALWNMSDAAETATGGKAYYEKRRDAILANVVSFIG